MDIPELNEYQKFLNDIRSYVSGYTSNILEKREFAINFFNRNKSNHKVYQALIQITDNLDESYDLRLQTITILKRIFNKRDFNSYIKVKKVNYENENSEYYEKDNSNNYINYTKMLGDGVNNGSKTTDEYLKLMLPSSNGNNELSLKEEDDIFLSHLGFRFEKNKKNNEDKNIKVSLIDSLFYIDHEICKTPKLQEMAKNLIIAEIKNLPNLESYRKMVDRHFDKFMMFYKNENENENYEENRSDTNNHIREENQNQYENTKLFLENEFKNIKENKVENRIFTFKDKIQTHFENPIPSKLNDEENWKKLISLTDISMQNFNIYNFNLDLSVKYGPIVWKKYIDNFESLVNLLEKEKILLKEKSDQINKERKFNQVIKIIRTINYQSLLKNLLLNNFR
jgi:hypothetical protein